jgi:phage gpG-like protein
VEIGTKVEYASAIQFGGISEVVVTLDVQRCIERYMGKHPEHADELAQFLVGEEYTIELKIPARPFVAATDKDVKDIERLVLDELTGGLNGGRR